MPSPPPGRGARGRQRRAGARRGRRRSAAGASASALDSVADPLAAVRQADEGLDLDRRAPLRSAWTPIGVAQVASSAATTARSAVSSAQRDLVADLGGGAAERSTVVRSRLQHQRSLSRRGGHRLGWRGRSSPRPHGRDGAGRRRRARSRRTPPRRACAVACRRCRAARRPPDRAGRQAAERAGAGEAVPTRAPSGTLVERLTHTDPDIGRVLPCRHSCDRQTVRHRRRQILSRVHPDVRSAVEQRRLDPPHKPRLVPHLTIGGHLDQLRPPQQLGNLARLRFGQCTVSSSDSDHSESALRVRANPGRGGTSCTFFAITPADSK